jgi:DNA-binding transcriptional ArsR family regulator
MNDLFYWLFIGTKGGINRIKIVKLLYENPYNAKNISDKLELNYKTVRHHLRLLEEHDIVTTPPGIRYGAVYFLTEEMKENYDLLEKIQEKNRSKGEIE